MVERGKWARVRPACPCGGPERNASITCDDTPGNDVEINDNTNKDGVINSIMRYGVAFIVYRVWCIVNS